MTINLSSSGAGGIGNASSPYSAQNSQAAAQNGSTGEVRKFHGGHHHHRGSQAGGDSPQVNSSTSNSSGSKLLAVA